ncbi:methyl-accepting chemotaxis protein [Desulfosporosinus sp. FKA]|uniref:methyl-accepting chemotaxis protein n=1 Tax=Desulfosporosinus sp. FKA TaxID=1969834 RepID=UPI000B4A4ED8|nr:methyl-accepting chemotaxis protein [Desulfosporosinus sp. FKA]
MKWFRHLNTSVKIMSLVVLMAVFLAAVGFTGYYNNKLSNNTIDILYLDKLHAISAIKEARMLDRNLEGLDYQFLLAQLDPEQEKRLQDQSNDLVKQIDQAIAKYQNAQLTPYETHLLPIFNNEWKSYCDQRQKALQIAQKGDKWLAYQYYVSNADTLLGSLNDHFQLLADYNGKTAKQLMEQAKNDYQISTLIIIGITLISVVLAIFLGLLIGKMISGPLKKVVSQVNEIADGNLNVEEVGIDSKDEIGLLAQAINTMTVSLKELIGQVALTSEQVASSAEELSTGAEESSQASEQIASAIAEVANGVEIQSGAVDDTSTAIERISVSIQEMATTASKVAQRMSDTSTSTEVGQKAVDDAVEQMGAVAQSTSLVGEAIQKLSTSSQQISDITNVISAIAEQTNLLALNAAIEAARAGEQGRGFAVVAEEVRKLAEQSAEAATKIATLIIENQVNIQEAVQAMEHGANDVQRGIDVVNKSGDVFAEIAQSVAEVAAQAQEISATTQQIAGTSQQVVDSVLEIDDISKKNSAHTQTVSAATEEQSASIEQIASASQSLAALAGELQNAISKFRL